MKEMAKLADRDDAKITRREFIKTTGGVVAATAIGASALSNMANADDEMAGEYKVTEKRKYGRHDDMLSIIGFGGIIVMNETPEKASAYVSEAIDHGINYFDVAPTYGDAELKLGPALEPYRKDVFLACKTEKREKSEAEKALKESLKRLKTDYLDLYQLHAMTTEDDFQKAMDQGGVMEVLMEAKKQGIVRYLGFSAHSVEIALKLMDAYDFDSILFPVNWVNYYNGNFGPQVVEMAKSKNMGILALKAMARTQWANQEDKKEYPKCWYEPITDADEAELAVRFTLSQPVTSAVPPGDIRLFRRAMKIASNYKPLTDDEIQIVKQKAEGLTPIFKYA